MDNSLSALVSALTDSTDSLDSTFSVYGSNFLDNYNFVVNTKL